MYSIFQPCVAGAEDIIKNKPGVLRLPGDPLTMDNIDAARKKSARS